jgi:hypothetical protein
MIGYIYKFGNALRKYGINMFDFNVLVIIHSKSNDNLDIILNCFEKHFMEKLCYRSIPIKQFSKEGMFIKQWSSITEAARYYNLPKSCISRVCKNERKSCGGFIYY